jgi:hypothetical protein
MLRPGLLSGLGALVPARPASAQEQWPARGLSPAESERYVQADLAR